MNTKNEMNNNNDNNEYVQSLADDTGIMEVTNVEHLPIDYYGPVLAPISAALRPWIKERWRVVRFCEEPVIVGGKNRFYRVELRLREDKKI